MRTWSDKTEIAADRFIGWVGVARGKFFEWSKRYGKVNEHNGLVPRDHWLDDWEKARIIDFPTSIRSRGIGVLTFMMLDHDVVAVSPSSVYRVLSAPGCWIAGTPSRRRRAPASFSRSAPHEHWHIDVAYLNLAGTFYYLCTFWTATADTIVHWEIREAMKEADVEIILQRAREMFPDRRPRIISDNGPQFIAKDFKEFIRVWQTTHVLTSPYYPQSNGKLERFHRTLKNSAIRPKTPLNLEDARRVAGEFIEHYNQVRLHSAIGYIAPADRLAGRQESIWAWRDRKLAEAREARRGKRGGEATAELATGKPAADVYSSTVSPEDRATQGCDPSAAGDSNTAGLGGGNAAQAGHLRDRSQGDKSQGAWGTESPEGTPPNSTNNRDGEVA